MNPPNPSQTHFLVHNYAKHYPDKVRLFVYAKPYEKKKPNMEPQPHETHYNWRKPMNLRNILTMHKNTPRAPLNASHKQKPVPMNPDSVKRSLNRTRTMIADLIDCNEFTHFGTFTFGHRYCSNPCDKTLENCKRFDDELMRRKLTQFLNHEQRKGKFQYLIVPERHKSGALHFHGLIKNYPGELKLSGVLDPAGRQIYNMTSFDSIGHNNFTAIENIKATANYCRKYITKDLANEKSRRRYWGSKDLKKPGLEYNLDPLEVLSNPHGEVTEVAKNPGSYTIFDIKLNPSPHTSPVTSSRP